MERRHIYLRRSAGGLFRATRARTLGIVWSLGRQACARLSHACRCEMRLKYSLFSAVGQHFKCREPLLRRWEYFGVLLQPGVRSTPCADQAEWGAYSQFAD